MAETLEMTRKFLQQFEASVSLKRIASAPLQRHNLRHMPLCHIFNPLCLTQFIKDFYTIQLPNTVIPIDISAEIRSPTSYHEPAPERRSWHPIR
jgi:hypothetical protein